MKDKINQMLRDKMFLVILVLGLLTIVAAAGVFTIQRGRGQESSPYLEMPGPDVIAQEETGGEVQEEQQIAGASDAQPREEELQMAEGTLPDSNAGDDLAAEAGAGQEAATPLVLNFSDASRLSWPVRGNVVLDYSMDQTIYFPTLDQYKCNPGIVIQSEVSTPVTAPANAKVLEVGNNEEIGNYVTMDLGNGYEAICGQLKEIEAVEGEYLEAAGIRKDGPVPVHKLVEAAELLNQLVPRSHMKVVGIGKLHLRTDLAQVIGGHGSLDGRHRSHVHK